MASSSHNVELEAAKFLHKLIQDSKDEPAKLATKLFVILQHMKSSGKEHSMPFHVISRAMETVINQHGLDMDALKSSRVPLTGGSQTVDSTSGQYAGSSQAVGVPKDPKAGLVQNEMSKIDPFSSIRPPVGPSITGHEYYQGAGTHRSSQSFDHESPSSLDARSANSQSQDKQMNQNDSIKAATKRKRGDSSSPLEPNFDNSQQLDSHNAVTDPRKGKMNKAEPSGPANYSMVLSSGQMEHFPSLPGNMRSMLRCRQDGSIVPENLVDTTSITNLMSRAPSSKYPEEVEVSSTHNVPGQQQGGVPGSHEVFSSRGVWNQNKAGLPFDRSQLHRFPPNVVSGNMTAEIPAQQSMHTALVSGAFGKVQGGLPATSNSYPSGELAFSGPGQFSGAESQKHGFSKGSVTSPDGLSTTLSAGKVLEHEGGSSNVLADANKIAQVGRQNSASEMTMLRATAPRDTGKSPVSQSATFSGMPFKEQQLKQLRAQCLVFLAFRNGLMPKKLHLEIALGNIYPKEVGDTDGPRKELIDTRGKAQTSNEPSSISEVAMPFGRMNNAPPGSTSTGRFPEADSLSKEAEKLKMEERNGPTSDFSAIADERKHILATRKAEAEIQSLEAVEPQAYLTTMSRQPESGTIKGGFTVSNPVDGMENGHLQLGKGDQASSVIGANKQLNPEMMGWSGIGCHNEVSRASLPAAAVQHDLVLERKDNAPSQFQSPEQDEEDKSALTDSLPSPKHTMLEKWIMDQQKRKFLAEQNWVLKQQKTKHRIVTCFTKLKENVSSSEDISAKTKSVIELKKLQLLELQRRLRSDFLNDFFKPITNDMERLKSYKKHRHGRRIKQLEKYEQKMKEERQKRIRERQKEFFSEIEVHKERLDDVFKIRRERWKGFNKYVKEFHKRKERTHREKIDRIQREKINLLKINDVEGYLRMVQDAKSDRVKQLLKETEKYLQKLGSKLQEAKAITIRFENDMDEMRTASVVENDTAMENEDEAKHYMESNEKYYMMAHSIKENISEQPTFLKGGKLREYQMNGLRWLVSLYNNHLNGILADEMGLGKTVQVISLICYLMETKNDRGPFLVVVPSSVLPGWESEINFWAPEINKIVYAGPPEERRRLFKERIVQRKFNVLLTTYEYLMNKHDRPKLSKLHWHYIIIDEGHRIKNASCKLNADLKHYQSSHRLLLTGTPLQNNLEELWALLNFLLPNIFNSSEDFSQWFNKPFESNGDNSADEALLSEEENLLIINRLHQVLRPFVLRRLKHKVENQLPEKIERLIRCEASAYQKLLMKRVEENLGAMGNSKARSVHNSVMELRNICNHPYLSQLHVEEVDNLIPQHYLPPMIRLCGKLEMLDRLLPKLKATDHRVLLFSTMTRLLDVMEDYLSLKQYRYLRLDGHTSGNDRGALIDNFNRHDSPFFIFLLSIRAGGVGVNLQAADTVIIFDTDWNPQVDLQAQARAHRIGQKKDVLVLRFETVQTVEEQVRAAAEHKLGVANQSITAGFFDNNTSAEDRREYLESLLRECKKEEAAPVLDDDALNDVLARSESEIDVFESVDKQRREEEMAKWKKLVLGSGMDGSKTLLPLPSRLVTDDDLQEFYEAMKLYDVPKTGVQPNVGVKRKGENLGGLDTRQYGRGKRAREVRSYEEQWTEEEFEKLCQVDSPESPKLKEEAVERNLPKDASVETVSSTEANAPAPPPPPPQPLPVEHAQQPQQQSKDATPPSKRGRGRPRRATADKSPTTQVLPAPSGISKVDAGLQKVLESSSSASPAPDPHNSTGVSQNLQPSMPSVSATPDQSNPPGFSPMVQLKGQGRKAQTGGQAPRRRGKKQEPAFSSAIDGLAGSPPKPDEQSQIKSVNPADSQAVAISGTVPGVSSVPKTEYANQLPTSAGVDCASGTNHPAGAGISLNSQSTPTPSGAPITQSTPPLPTVPVQVKGQGRKAQSGLGPPRRRGKKQAPISAASLDVSAGQDSKSNPQAQDKSADAFPNKVIAMRGNQENDTTDATKLIQEQAQGTKAPAAITAQDQHSTESQSKQPESSQAVHNSTAITLGPAVVQIQNADVHEKASVITEVSPECSSQKSKSGEVCGNQGGAVPVIPVLSHTSVEVVKNQISEDKVHATISTVKTASSVAGATMDCLPSSDPLEGANKTMPRATAKIASSSQPFPTYAPVASAPQSVASCPAECVQSKRPGRKTTNRAEAPKRRGRKPVIPDASSGQDLKVNSQPQNKSRDLLVNKAPTMKNSQDSGPHELANVTQVHASEVHSPGALVGHDSKRKVTSAIQFTRIQTADVNDVARVMKEIFSETCSSKTKVGEPAGSEGWNTPTAPLSSKTLEEVTKNQSLDGKTCVNSPAHDQAAAACDVPTEKNTKQAETKADAKELEDNTSLVVKDSVQRADSLKPKCKTHTGFDNIADSGQTTSENSITESNMEVDSTCPLNAGEKKDVCQGPPGPGGDHTGSRVQPDPPGPMDLPQTAESDKTNIAPVFKESPKADNTCDNSRAVPSVAGVVEPSIIDSETKKESPGMTEIYPGNEVEPSLKESPKASDDNGRSVGLNGIPSETLDSDLSAVNLSGISFDKSDLPSVVLKCSTEAIVVEGPEVSENSDNLGATAVVDDAAPACETSILDEAPVDNCDVDGQFGCGEAKGDPVPESFLSTATDSTDTELVPQDGGGLQQPLVVKDGEGDGVEIHNMEVDPSETDVPSLNDFTVESASRDPASEFNGGKQLCAGVKSTKGDYVEVCDAEVKPSVTQSSEPAMSSLEIAVPVSDNLQDKNIEQPRIDADANKSEEKPPVVVMTPISESVSLVSQCQAAIGSENISDSRKLSCENSNTESSMGVDCKVHLSAREEEDFASQGLKSPNGDSTDLTDGPSSNQIELSVASPIKVEPPQLNSCGNKTEISSMSPCDVSKLESLIDSTNGSDVRNHSEAISSISVLIAPNVASSEDKEKSSMEFSNSSPLDISSSKAGAACDYSGVTAVVPLSSDHSVAGSLPDLAIPSENSSEPSARESLGSSAINVESAEGTPNVIKFHDVADNPGESLPITIGPDKSGTVDTPAMVESNSECEAEPCPDKSGMVEAPAMVENNSECEAESFPDKSGVMEAPAMVEDNPECEAEPCPDKSGMIEAPAMVENNSECEAEPCPDKSGMVEAPAMVANNSECEAEPCPDNSGMVEAPVMVENNSECEAEPCPDKSGMVEAPSVVETNSEREAESSLESCQKASALDVENLGSAAMSKKPDINDVPLVTSSISPSPIHSAMVELPAITESELGKATEPSLEESLQSSATERGNLEALSVSTKSHALSDHCPEAVAAECCGEAFIGGPEVSQKSNDPGAAPVVVDTAAGDNHVSHQASDNVDGPSSGSENKRDSVSDPIHLVASESTNIETMPKDDALQVSSSVERGDGNSVDVSNEEVDPSGQPISSMKDFAAESANVDFVPGDHGEVKPSLGIESIGSDHVDNDADPLEIEASIEQDVVGVPSGMELVPGDHNKMHLEVGVASTEGDNIQVRNTEVDPLEAHATSSEFTTKESPNGEHVLNDQSQELPGIEKMEADNVEASTIGLNSSEAQESSLQSGDSDNRELVQRSEVDLVEPCNVESDPTEGPSSSQVISDASANPELTHSDQVRTDLQSEDHGKASQLPEVESTNVSNMEIDPTETKASSPGGDETDVSNMEIDPIETKAPSSGADGTNA
ncbi:PREDICTED: chromatin structure-remodeling complex protein SYD isoform X1 [Theobroma cacao]|uniref:Chromatin structure-remodeling complex protein SYD isoform X1 n=1 Tax=Theobroma cacao TaxID=3641 RepID=A0AB32V8H1_THECC|nr:PREDICTED: chromatin structure-remodeling complex protein SYD isoform X1 [Theobroma cacao]